MYVECLSIHFGKILPWQRLNKNFIKLLSELERKMENITVSYKSFILLLVTLEKIDL